MPGRGVCVSSSLNIKVGVQCRVPKCYSNKHQYNVLVLFGGRNTDGKADASGCMGWGMWCDEDTSSSLCPDDNSWGQR